jgi:hypothetical protein
VNAGILMLAGGLLLAAAAAQASVVQGPILSKNECAGHGFTTCYATATGTQGTAGTGAVPTIYKQNSNGSADFGSFSSITGLEFAISFDSNAKTLSFNYTPQAGDPEIHAFVIFQAGKGVLFYDLDSAITNFTFAMTDVFGKQAGGWSHLTFFGSASAAPPPPTPDPQSAPLPPALPVLKPTPVAVPAPAALPVMGAALLGLALVRRPRRRTAPRAEARHCALGGRRSAPVIHPGQARIGPACVEQTVHALSVCADRPMLPGMPLPGGDRMRAG